MSALALISEFSELGIKVRPNGQDVAVSPKKALTPELLERIKQEKPALLRELERVRKEAGRDWEEIASNPKQLKEFYELLMISEMRSQGIAPDHYTDTTTCKHCGPVPIWEGCPPEVLGCPWCFNRIKGLKSPEVNNDE
jgi:hypothetical protein